MPKFMKATLGSLWLGCGFVLFHSLAFEAACYYWHPPTNWCEGFPAWMAALLLIGSDALAMLCASLIQVPWRVAFGLAGSMSFMLLIGSFTQNPYQGQLMGACWAIVFAAAWWRS